MSVDQERTAVAFANRAMALLKLGEHERAEEHCSPTQHPTASTNGATARAKMLQITRLVHMLF